MAEEKVLINNEAVPVSKTTTVISLDKPSPAWATWIFRTEFVLNKVVLFILSGTSLVSPSVVKESLLWIAGLDLLVWGMGRFIGMKKTEFEDEN